MEEVSFDILKEKKVAISIFSERKKDWVFDFQGESPLIPNSIIKIITASAALKFLGKNFRFKTKLLRNTEIVEGELLGNLIILGSGDPTLGSHRELGISALMKRWSLSIQDHGIRSVLGKIEVDNTCFDLISHHSSWLDEDVANYYGAGVFGFNIHENLFNLSFKLGQKEGDKTTLELISPYLPFVEIENQVISAKKGSGDKACIYNGNKEGCLIVKGTLPLDAATYVIKGAIHKPSEVCLYHLTDQLKSKDIIVKNKKTSAKKNKVEIIDEIDSAPLYKIVFLMNKLSINLYAEALLKKISHELFGLGQYSKSVEIVNKYLKDLKIEGVNIVDGSGLSNQNQITTKAMTSFLYKISQEDYFPFLLESLPSTVEGDISCLTKQYPDDLFKGRLFAKTGSSRNKRSLAGILITKSGDRLFFCYMENDLDENSSRLFRERLKSLFDFLILS